MDLYRFSGDNIVAVNGTSYYYICLGTNSSGKLEWQTTSASNASAFTKVSSAEAAAKAKITLDITYSTTAREKTTTPGTTTYKTTDTYFPLTWADPATNGDTTFMGPTTISSKNTGYVISGANMDEDNPYADLRVSQYPIGSIYKSLGGLPPVRFPLIPPRIWKS